MGSEVESEIDREGEAAAGKVTKEVVGKGQIKGSGKGREM